MKFTHTHKPTGKPCAIVSLLYSGTVAQINLGPDVSDPFPRVDMYDLTPIKPTAAQEAIATADSYLSNAVLPTYSELLDMLRHVTDEYQAAVAKALPPVHAHLAAVLPDVIDARALLSRHDRTLAGDFKS